MGTVLTAIVCGVAGLGVGSFLNVVIERVPRKEPVMSWLASRGSRPAEPIGRRDAIVTLACAALFVAAALRFHGRWELPAFCVFFASLLAISAIDLEHYIIPNRVVYPTIWVSLPLLAVAAAGQHTWVHFEHALYGAASAFLLLLVVHLVSPRGMGFGDVRLSFVIGLFLGWLDPWGGHVFLGLFLGFLLGSFVGLVLMALRRRHRKDHIPFGPFLAAGAVVAALFGHPIVDWYLNR